MSKSKKALIFILGESSQFVELGKIAHLLKESNGYEPLLSFHSERNIKKCIEFCKKNEISFFLSHENNVPPANIKNKAKLQKSKLRPNSSNKLLWSLKNPRTACRIIKDRVINWAYNHGNIPIKVFFDLFRFINYYFYKINRIKKLRHYIETEKPEIVIIAEDNIEYGTPELINVCNKLNIPSVIFPYTIANHKEAVQSLSESKDYLVSKGSTNILFQDKLKAWIYKDGSLNLMRYPWYKALVTDMLGLRPPKPWTFNSGFATKIAVESQFMFNYYLESGIEEEQLVQVGSLSLDNLHNQINSKERHKELFQELDLDADKPIILCSIPTNLSKRKINQFAKYEEFLQSFLNSFKEIQKYNIIFKLHPNIPLEEKEAIKEKYNIKFSSWDTSDLIPFCKFYVASVSATIRWALACRKPVLNYDCYQFDYGDFNFSKQVVTVDNIESFQKYLFKFAEDAEYLNSLISNEEKNLSEDLNYWGKLDGNSHSQIIKLFDNLTKKNVIDSKLHLNTV